MNVSFGCKIKDVSNLNRYFEDGSGVIIVTNDINEFNLKEFSFKLFEADKKVDIDITTVKLNNKVISFNLPIIYDAIQQTNLDKIPLKL